MQINKLEKAVSYKDRVYEEIKSAIIAQRLNPGEPLNERLLAEKMGISRTPVREALQMLEKEGWVLTEPWKGTYVLDLTNDDIEEVFQLRRALEPLVVELVIAKLDDNSSKELKALLQRQIDSQKHSDPDEFIRFDRDLHMYLAELAANKRLIQILSNLSDMMRRLGVKAITDHERYKEVVLEHQKIIDGILNKDVLAAHGAICIHLRKTEERFYQYWKNGN